MSTSFELTLGSETEIFLSDADVPRLDEPPARPSHERLVSERIEKEAAFNQMYRLVDDFHRLRCERDAAFRALTRAHHETLFRLAHAAELKEGDSGVRIVRIGALAAVVGRALGRPMSWCGTLLHAAPMLDVGKIGVPERILRDAQAIDEADTALLRSHTEIGARILGGSDIPVLNMASGIALCHHEHWDGGGYPAGLTGKDIPLAARIVAAVDHFDHQTTARADAAARPDAEVLDEIARLGGTRFDPAVARAMLANGSRLSAVRAFVNDQRLGSDGRNWDGDWWTVF